MLQYGKLIDKNIKSSDLKIECQCLSLAMASAFDTAFYQLPAGTVVCVPESVNERLLFDREA
jgi:hypothetical protein